MTKHHVEFMKTEPTELNAVNKLIFTSKHHWYPDEEYLSDAMKFIRIDETWLKENEGFSLYDGEELVGFLGFSRYEEYWYLEHLWIHPSKIGEHYGSSALEYLKASARQAGVHKISLLPEPKAEGFYQQSGAIFSGLDVPSLVEGGPVFKEMIMEF